MLTHSLAGFLFFLPLSATNGVRSSIPQNIETIATGLGQSGVYRVTRLRIDGVHRQKFTGIGPVVLKVVRVTGAAYSGNPMDRNLYAPFCPFSHTQYSTSTVVMCNIALTLSEASNIVWIGTPFCHFEAMRCSLWFFESPIRVKTLYKSLSYGQARSREPVPNASKRRYGSVNLGSPGPLFGEATQGSQSESYWGGWRCKGPSEEVGRRRLGGTAYRKTSRFSGRSRAHFRMRMACAVIFILNQFCYRSVQCLP